MTAHLQELWLGGRTGTLCALEQAKAWALREAWLLEHESTYGMHTWIAERVKKVGGGSPSKNAVKNLLDTVDGDPDWYPGKRDESTTKPGPKPVLRGAKLTALCNSAMKQKRKLGDVSFRSLVSTCPNALRNPDTGEPVDKKQVYTALKQHCYDDSSCPEKTWEYQARYSKTALTQPQQQKRLNWADYLLGLRHRANWYYDKLVWTDICNHVLPRSEHMAALQSLARKGKKGWASAGCQQYSQNLRAAKEHLKMAAWDTERVWFCPVLSRGKLHVAVLPPSFPGEEPAGATMLVAKVKAALNLRFQGNANPPRMLMVDRGKGFFHPANGKVTTCFKNALVEHGLTTFNGHDASVQPGALQELMLHETAMAWLRLRLAKTTPPRAWEETVDAFCARLTKCCAYINEHYDVEGLCRGFLERVELLRELEGGRLKK